MHTWFECKIKYEKTADDGNIIKVLESYLVDALSFTEAEARIIEEMKPFINGEFQVTNVRRSRISELFFNDNGDKWYRCKVMYITLNEEKGIEKKTPATMYVQASDIDEALSGLKKGMSGSMADYIIHTITESTVLDVYKYDAK